MFISRARSPAAKAIRSDRFAVLFNNIGAVGDFAFDSCTGTSTSKLGCLVTASMDVYYIAEAYDFSVPLFSEYRPLYDLIS